MKIKELKNLSLTDKGIELEKKLSNIYKLIILKNILKNADETDINGFKKILYAMIDEKTQKNLIKLINNLCQKIF